MELDATLEPIVIGRFTMRRYKRDGWFVYAVFLGGREWPQAYAAFSVYDDALAFVQQKAQTWREVNAIRIHT